MCFEVQLWIFIEWRAKLAWHEHFMPLRCSQPQLYSGEGGSCLKYQILSGLATRICIIMDIKQGPKRKWQMLPWFKLRKASKWKPIFCLGRRSRIGMLSRWLMVDWSNAEKSQPSLMHHSHLLLIHPSLISDLDATTFHRYTLQPIWIAFFIYHKATFKIHCIG